MNSRRRRTFIATRPHAVAAAGPLVDIDHETGDLSEYSGSEGTVSATAGAALAGTSYGLAVEITEGVGGGAWVMFDPAITPDVLRARVYLDPNGLTMADGDEVDVMYLKPGFLYLVKSGSNYAVKALYYTDDLPGATDLAVITDAPHYIEVQIARASAELATDGTCQIWVDGVSADSVTGIANYSVFVDTEGAALGQSSSAGATVSGTLYLDEWIVNDTGDEIGPVA